MDDNGYLAFALLISALSVFLISTRQFKLWVRAAIWFVGVGLLLGAIISVAGDQHHRGLFRALLDLMENWRNPSNSVIFQAFQRNASGVGRFIFPLLDVFLALAVLLSVLAFLAFTPGERLERLIRPMKIGLIGAIGGGILALAVVGMGFGSVTQPRAYASVISASDVHDGDTFWIGEVSVRLHGADAPELRQLCFVNGQRSSCGEEAKNDLQALLDGELVACTTRQSRTGKLSGSFGRPHVWCRVVADGDDVDVGAAMVRSGMAIEYEGRAGSYRREAADALQDHRGAMGACFLRPDIQRSRRHARERANFDAGNLADLGEFLVGAGCPNGIALSR